MKSSCHLSLLHFACALALAGNAAIGQDVITSSLEGEQEASLPSVEQPVQLQEKIAEQQLVIDALRQQIILLEQELAVSRNATLQLNEKISALGNAPIEGAEALQQRLLEAVSSAVHYSIQVETLQNTSIEAIEKLTLLSGLVNLSEENQASLGETITLLNSALKNSEAFVEPEKSFVVVEYDPQLRLAIFEQGLQDGVRTGLRLQTEATEENPVQELLVVDVRPHVCGAIQVDNLAKELTIGDFLQPILENR